MTFIIIILLTVDTTHFVILGIDANETLYDKVGESAILGLVGICGLIDVMASINPDDPPPLTRCDWVDFIFATTGVHKNIIIYYAMTTVPCTLKLLLSPILAQIQIGVYQ
jgi:hypothetical protein